MLARKVVRSTEAVEAAGTLMEIGVKPTFAGCLIRTVADVVYDEIFKVMGLWPNPDDMSGATNQKEVSTWE
jgi:hypothetical protein